MLKMSSSTKIKYAFDIPNLIKAIEKRPGLYDISSPGYRDRCTKKKLWDEVCIDVCTVDEWNRLTKTAKGELGFELQRKWHNLRSCYRRELSTLYKKHTGQLGNKIKRTYYYFKALDFLRPHCIDARFPLNDIPTEVETDHSVDLETEYVEDPLDNDDESDQDNRSPSPSSSHNYDQSMDLEDIKAEDDFVSNAQKNDCSMTRDQHGYSKNCKGNKKYSEVEFRVRRSEDDVENNTRKEKKRKEDKVSDDGDEEFLKSLLPSLREFTPDQKLLLRIEMMKTILNFKKSQK